MSVNDAQEVRSVARSTAGLLRRLLEIQKMGRAIVRIREKELPQFHSQAITIR
jgi:hypothetical protein